MERGSWKAAFEVVLLVLLISRVQETKAQFLVGFYDTTCPQAESLITETVNSAVQADVTMAASLLRFVFHDCFVQGCDASVLLDSTPAFGQAEKDAPPNQSLRGFEVFDTAKAAVEAVCPKVVSCADIIALAGRDAAVAVGAPSWQVPTGRRDGTISQLLDAGINIPMPTLPYQLLLQSFLVHGLSEDDMITLSGAHTIGRAHCSAFTSRLYPTVDPTLDPAYAAQLQSLCPQNGSPNTLVPLDYRTPDVFDINYYVNLGIGRALMPTDQELLSDLYGTQTTALNVQNPTIWGQKFSNAMFRLSQLNMKLNPLGEVRSNCHVRG
ncbi:unnamed protein product [Calypogeia fissa]